MKRVFHLIILDLDCKFATMNIKLINIEIKCFILRVMIYANTRKSIVPAKSLFEFLWNKEKNMPNIE